MNRELTAITYTDGRQLNYNMNVTGLVQGLPGRGRQTEKSQSQDQRCLPYALSSWTHMTREGYFFSARLYR